MDEYVDTRSMGDAPAWLAMALAKSGKTAQALEVIRLYQDKIKDDLSRFRIALASAIIMGSVVTAEQDKILAAMGDAGDCFSLAEHIQRKMNDLRLQIEYLCEYGLYLLQSGNAEEGYLYIGKAKELSVKFGLRKYQDYLRLYNC